jgi:putative membrane protein
MKTTQIPLRCAAVLMAASLFTTLTAQTDSALPNSPTKSARADDNLPTALSHSDKAFLEKAAKAGMKEVDVSQTVEERLTNPQVRIFAQMMVTDHAKANEELTALAARKGVNLPPDKMKYTEKWSKKDKDLDEDYVKEMKDDHEEAVKLFEKASKSDDADIAAFAQKTLPTLQHHLSMVSELKNTVK